MSLFRSMGARKDSTRGTTPIEVRKALALLFTGPGIIPGAPTALVTGTAGWAYSVNAAGFVSTRGAADGVHLYGNDGTVTVGATGVGSTVPVAPGSGLQRIDIIWVKHPSASENSDTTSEPTFGVTSGDASSSALPPTIPAGALELARNLMTSSATSTASTGNSITQNPARTALRGNRTHLWGYGPLGDVATMLFNGTLVTDASGITQAFDLSPVMSVVYAPCFTAISAGAGLTATVADATISAYRLKIWIGSSPVVSQTFPATIAFHGAAN